MLALDLMQSLPDAQHRGDRRTGNTAWQGYWFILIELARLEDHRRSHTRKIGWLKLAPDAISDALCGEKI